ncbi:MAG TPA: hypothetical protein VFS17_11315, partial [Methylophilaceae bacterium]|nr:hypothetical protein [Methylophilaceae bacterium]
MLKLYPQKVTFILSMIALCLVIANCLGLIAKAAGHDFLGGLVPLFDMDEEKNIPTFFSTFLAVIASGLLFAIGMARKQVERPWRLWIGLSLVFLLVGMDDFVAIHEHLNRPIRSLFHAKDIFYFAWIIPYGLFVMVLAG